MNSHIFKITVIFVWCAVLFTPTLYLFYRWRACKQADSKKGWSHHRVTLSTWFAFNRKKGIIHGQYFVWLSSNCSQILWDQGHYLFLIYLQFVAERYLLKYLAGWNKILKLCTYVFNFISQRIFKNVAEHIRCHFFIYRI